MTASVRLCELVPGDEVLDLIVAGTVENVEQLRHNDGRLSDAIRVDFTNGLQLSGPSTWTVVTMREAADA